jgi:hypothetical protein
LAGVGLGCHFEEQGSAFQNSGVVDDVAEEGLSSQGRAYMTPGITFPLKALK